MGIFSKRVSIAESDGYAIQALGMGILKLDEDVRKRIGPVMVAAVQKHLKNQNSYLDAFSQDTLKMFQIISGTVGVEPTDEIDTYGSEADAVRDIIESTLPINIPMAVIPVIRMTIEEFLTGKKLTEINLEKFDDHDSRKVVNALMEAVRIVNERCVTDPRNHPSNEVLCLAYLTVVVCLFTKKQIPFK